MTLPLRSSADTLIRSDALTLMPLFSRFHYSRPCHDAAIARRHARDFRLLMMRYPPLFVFEIRFSAVFAFIMMPRSRSVFQPLPLFQLSRCHAAARHIFRLLCPLSPAAHRRAAADAVSRLR